MTLQRLTLQPVAGPVRATIRPPGSKSLTNRALLCAALAQGASTLHGVLDSEDTQVMRLALEQLGLNLSWHPLLRLLEVHGQGGIFPVSEAELFVANSGTTMRFLAAALAGGDGCYRLDGVARMRERPMQDLLQAIRQLGGHAISDNALGTPPLTVGPGPLQGGTARVAGDVSSQFLSGLLMAAPYARHDVELIVEGELVSRPYVAMTLGVMKSFGVDVEQRDQGRQFCIAAGQRYQGCSYEIEPDASAASYFWSIAAITGGTVTVQGLHWGALQGDVNFCRCLEKMGCRVESSDRTLTVHGPERLRGIDVDMNEISDTAPTLAVTALFAEGRTIIRGVAHNRYKETDRISDLARELRKLGAHVTERHDGLQIDPAPLHSAEIATYNDHRMAMSFALAGLRQSGVEIQNPACTAKTYPDFFDDLRSVCAAASEL